ncbi:unnamed protein product [Adineta ricciae]|uniref:Transcription factor BYE1 n=1 Tax=Adineta ricciae TaxID=249248 RepID=A0A815CIQ6_ADIRI|nr:unnamed protein product [Adineta ricciae]CAF1285691.1 unnamed protein product [Adineta ricciae]
MNTSAHSTASSSKGSPSGDPGVDDSNSKDISSSNCVQEDEDDPYTYRSRKSYPQRVNRPKLNYRDLERGVYDAHELRQSSWALGGPTFLNRNNRTGKNTTNYSDDENDDDDNDQDTPANDDENEEIFNEKKSKSNDDTDQKHRRLWCICKKPWDHSRLMLRCDSCANWYHGDCIGVTKEQARVLDMNGDQFVCPPCRGVASSNSGIKSGRSSDESLLIKRKRIDADSPSDRKVGERNGNVNAAKNLTLSEPSKRPKTGVFFQRDTTTEPQIHCIAHGCSNWAKSSWVYCSPACIRRHINDTLQAIQRSKGADNESPPTREDILLYQSRTKKVLDRKLVPKVEDLCTWINQNPSYEIVKPALRQSILLTANESKSAIQPTLARSPSLIAPKTPTTPTTPTSTKPKLSWVPVAPSTKSVPIKKAPVQLGKQTSNTPSSPSVPNYADIRTKVPQALYDKLITRLEKSGEKTISNEDIHTLTNKIEEEMYRVYGKVDNSYKNKFRSLLANISNMNNNFFYKHILSKEVTAKQIVAMKPEDMLPPEEKEKRKDDFNKEVQMIMKAEEQTAEEMARRARTKLTRQGIVDNDSVLTMLKEKEQIISQEKTNKSTEAKPVQTSEVSRGLKKAENNSNVKSIPKAKKPTTLTTGQKPALKPKPKPNPPISASTDDTKSASSDQTVNVSSTESKVSSPKPIIPTEAISQPMEPLLMAKQVDEQSPASPIHEESQRSPPISTFMPVDIDNDYIEPESPTGIDALLYDDDDDLNNAGTHSRPSISHQLSESSGDNTDYVPSVPASVRNDYNPLTASKPKTESSSAYLPTPIARPSSANIQWRGVILPPDAKIPCQSTQIYGDSEYLIADIPEQLGVLGRLRLGDLWDYVRDSLPVRDVVILTLVSSNNNENQAFSRYVESMRTSGRATVINKRSEPTVIRDMYVLPADTKDCALNVLETFSLPKSIDSQKLFLVVIGVGKKSSKSASRSNEIHSMSNLTYKPVALQDPASQRDPRLLRHKDPRLATSTSAETTTTIAENTSPPTLQSSSIDPMNQIPPRPSANDLNKLIFESLERIRQSTSLDAIQSIALSTIDLLNSSGHADLSARFAKDLQEVMSQWQATKDSAVNTSTTSDDNLNEENMEVDDEQDDKNKKQSSSISEFNDVDYRFLDPEDIDHRMETTAYSATGQQNPMIKSHFSSLFRTHIDADDRSSTSHLSSGDRKRVNS